MRNVRTKNRMATINELSASKVFWLAKNSICSGSCAAMAGMFGKLAGTDYNEYFMVFRLTYFALMIACNIGVWTFYVKALQAGSSTVSATVSTAACNYLLSAAVGRIFFNETATQIWWLSMFFILLGLFFMVYDEYRNEIKSHKS